MQTIRHFWPEFFGRVKALPDGRFQPFVDYDIRFLIAEGLLAFVLKLGSRRQIDYELRDEETEALANINRLAGTHEKSVPVNGTLEHLFDKMEKASQAMANLRTWMVQRLIRMKALDEGRLLGRFVLVPDGTGLLAFDHRHCPYCLVQKHQDTTLYLHQVLEVKLVTPGGLSLSVESEFIENPADYQTRSAASEEERKQDCELVALSRVGPRLRKAFPQTPFCLSGDSLYACGRSIQLAEDNRWAYVYAFLPTHMPAVWEDFQSLLRLAPENKLPVFLPDGTRRRYRWVRDLSYEDSEGRTHTFNAIECQETRDGETKTFSWITNLPVTAKNVDLIAMNGGRIRSKIENQGFNIQKNSDLNLEHAYSQNPENYKAYYGLLQMAHIILQLLEHGSLLRRVAAQRGKTPMGLFGSLKNIAARLRDAFRFFLLPDEAFALNPSLRIALDSS